MRTTALWTVLILALGACGAEELSTTDRPATDQAGRPPTSPVPPDELAPGGDSLSPPPVLVRSGGKEISLDPWSFCWTEGLMGACADGSPPEPLVDVGGPEEIEVAFDVPGWEFMATATPTGDRCGRVQTVELEATGSTTHRLVPIGVAGDYEITLFGRGGEAAGDRGDVSASFRWHTPQDGPDVAPSATASIVAGDPSAPESYGVEVRFQDLREIPPTVSATVLVTSSDGDSLAIDLGRQSVECESEGSVTFAAAEALGAQAAKLGPAPFRYDVTLVLDSVTHRGTATWPDDVDPECSPCAALRFSPPLPGHEPGKMFLESP